MSSGSDPARHFAAVSRRLPQIELGTPIPTFRAVLNNHFITVATDNQALLDFDYWEIGDDRFFEEGAFNGNYLQTLYIRNYGAWIFNVAIWWDNVFTPDSTILLHDPYRNSVTTDGRTGNAFDDYYTLCSMRTFTPFDPFNNDIDPDSPPTAFEIGVSVNQNSGVDQDVLQATLEIIYLGGMSVPTPTPATLQAPYDPGRIAPTFQ